MKGYIGVNLLFGGVSNLCDHTFLPSLLTDGVVLDLGANHGEFSKEISRLFRKRCVALEPVPSLFDKLPAVSGVKWIKAALADQDGTLKIFLHLDRCASFIDAGQSNQAFVEAQAISLPTLLVEENISSVDLLKMDIEGVEVPILEKIKLEDLSHINQITIEFHDFLYPELKSRVEAIKDKLEVFGFYCIPFSLTNNGDVLFVRKEKISWRYYIVLKFFWRYILGVIRRLKKIFNVFLSN
jgi:FkbM family methyltransferase